MQKQRRLRYLFPFDVWWGCRVGVNIISRHAGKHPHLSTTLHHAAVFVSVHMQFDVVLGPRFHVCQKMMPVRERQTMLLCNLSDAIFVLLPDPAGDR